jgi:hypothetical protein
MSEKCVCHINGYRIKDGIARQEIDVLKSRMNTFTSLPEGSTTGDAELLDIRNGADGTVYKTAGEAVREQFKNIKIDVDDTISMGSTNPVSGGAIYNALLNVGMPQHARILLLEILKNAIYVNDQSNNISTLENVFNENKPVYSISYNISQYIDKSNNNIFAYENEPFSCTLTPQDDYGINNVNVTMGGVDITSTVYSNGVITIPSVTGSIVITATVVEDPWEYGKYLSYEKKYNLLDNDEWLVTPYIPIATDVNSTIHAQGNIEPRYTMGALAFFYTEDKTPCDYTTTNKATVITTINGLDVCEKISDASESNEEVYVRLNVRKDAYMHCKLWQNGELLFDGSQYPPTK